MKAYSGGIGYTLNRSHNLAVDGNEWLTASPGRFTNQEITPIPTEWEAG